MRLAPHRVPVEGDRARWQAADRAARPERLERLRAELAGAGVDAYLGVRPESSRYLTGFILADGEERVAGSSGRFLVSADETVVLADPRYRLQATEQCPGSRVVDLTTDLVAAWPALLRSLAPISGGPVQDGVRRVAVEGGHLAHTTWLGLAEGTPDLELVPAEGWLERHRAVKEPAELERIAAACAIADAALEATLPEIRPGSTERELALALEWRIRTGGADALAFGVACLSGPRAALPHGSPGDRRVRAGEVLLFDFGAQVEGYRSDMTRTLFVGDPTPRDLELHELVASAQRAAVERVATAVGSGEPITNRDVDRAARDVIEAAGHGRHFGHGTGHGIGLATHELPSLGRAAAEALLPSPTVFSVEPGVYLDGQTGIRIEDLLAVDMAAASTELLTRFPRTPLVVGV